MDIGTLGSFDDRFLTCPQIAISDIFFDRTVKQKHILLYDPDIFTQ